MTADAAGPSNQRHCECLCCLNFFSYNQLQHTYTSFTAHSSDLVFDLLLARPPVRALSTLTSSSSTSNSFCDIHTGPHRHLLSHTAPSTSHSILHCDTSHKPRPKGSCFFALRVVPAAASRLEFAACSEARHAAARSLPRAPRESTEPFRTAMKACLFLAMWMGYRLYEQGGSCAAPATRLGSAPALSRLDGTESAQRRPRQPNETRAGK